LKDFGDRRVFLLREMGLASIIMRQLLLSRKILTQKPIQTDMKFTLLTLVLALASLTLGACKHRNKTPVATPTGSYSTGYGAVK